MKGFVSFMEGFALGGVVGVALALLLAPASGEELRGQIQSEVTRVRSEVQKAASDRRIELEQQLATLRTPRVPSSGTGGQF
jgi:gas vesicle protein